MNRTCCLVLCTSILLLSGMDHLQAQVATPGLNAAQRLELAKTFLGPIREAALADPASPERLHFLTEYTAQYEPVWTARFIIENPPPDDGVLYDNTAMRELMQRPGDIPEDLLLELLQTSEKRFTIYTYALLAVRHLPGDHRDLRQSIIDLALQPREPSQNAVQTFGAKLELARRSRNPDHVRQIHEKINEFYTSGKANELWQQALSQESEERALQDPAFRQGFAQMLTAFAPPEYQDDFLVEAAAPFDPLAFLRNESISDFEKLQKLESVDRVDFGRRTHEQMSMAGLMGIVAQYDPDRALNWAESALHERAKIWARLVIAPSLAREDPERAKRLVRECYDGLVELDSSDTDSANYNFSPTRISSAALPLVAAVDPKLVDDCIRTTEEISLALQTSRLHTAQDDIFTMIAAIAPYDMDRATQLFDQYSDDVRLNSAAAFFRALLAVYPDQVWQEYQEMPESSEQGIDFRIYVRNEILPALLKQDDAEFWRRLNNTGSLAFDARIVEP